MACHRAPIIGYHRAPLSQKFGAPRQPNLVAMISMIEMSVPYDTPAAFVGLAEFSHIWLSWQFHHNYLTKESHLNKESHSNKESSFDKSNEPADSKTDIKFRPQVRPPRLGGNQKIGVFASRSMYRPSGLGLSVVKLEKVAVIEGRVLLLISGADMIDGTPIIDIKPYVTYSDALIDANSGFAPTAPAPLMVTMTQSAHEQFTIIVNTEQSDKTNYKNNHANSGMENAALTALVYKMQKQLLASDIDSIKALIAQDPRPAYRREELGTKFTMRYKSVDVSFQQIEKGQMQIMTVVEVD